MLKGVVDKWSVELSRPDGPTEFSNRGYPRLLKYQTAYLEYLGLEAIRIARQANVDVVSACDVDKASRIIQSGHHKAKTSWTGPIGGVIGGGGLAQLFLVLSSKSPVSTLAWLLAVVPLVLASVLLSRSFTGDVP